MAARSRNPKVFHALEALYLVCFSAGALALGVITGLYSDRFYTVFDLLAFVRSGGVTPRVPLELLIVSGVLLGLSAGGAFALSLFRLARGERVTSWEWALLLFGVLFFFPAMQFFYLLALEGQDFYATRAIPVLLGFYYGPWAFLGVLLLALHPTQEEETERQLQELTGTVPVDLPMEPGEKELYRIHVRAWHWYLGTLILTDRRLFFSGTARLNRTPTTLSVPYDRLVRAEQTIAWITVSRKWRLPTIRLTYRDDAGRERTFHCSYMYTNTKNALYMASMKATCTFLWRIATDTAFRREVREGRQTTVVDSQALERRVEREQRYNWIFLLMFAVIVFYPKWYVILGTFAVLHALIWFLKRHARVDKGE